jgi:hypothetical protein
MRPLRPFTLLGAVAVVACAHGGPAADDTDVVHTDDTDACTPETDLADCGEDPGDFDPSWCACLRAQCEASCDTGCTWICNG